MARVRRRYAVTPGRSYRDGNSILPSELFCFEVVSLIAIHHSYQSWGHPVKSNPATEGISLALHSLRGMSSLLSPHHLSPVLQLCHAELWSLQNEIHTCFISSQATSKAFLTPLPHKTMVVHDWKDREVKEWLAAEDLEKKGVWRLRQKDGRSERPAPAQEREGWLLHQPWQQNGENELSRVSAYE